MSDDKPTICSNVTAHREAAAMIRSAFIALAVMGLAATAARAETRTVAYDAVSLEVSDEGKGPAIVMLPSLGRGSSDFDDLAARLVKAGYRVIRPQPRGIGASTGPMTGLTLRSLSDDVAQVITSSKIGSAIVLGHDDGNRIARATAAYHPELVKRVILVGAGGEVLPDAEAAAALKAVFDPALSPQDHLHVVQVAFFAPGHDPSVWAGGWYPAVAAMEREANSQTPLQDWWTAGAAQVLVVQGDQDRIAPPANGDRLKIEIRERATVVHLDGAGHALLPEQPERLAEIIVGYLRQASQGG